MWPNWICYSTSTNLGVGEVDVPFMGIRLDINKCLGSNRSHYDVWTIVHRVMH